MKCGINGAEHDFNEIPCGINGAVRQASELWIGVNGAVKKVWPTLPVGYQEILDVVGVGTWVCPASGKWTLEMHGGGGAAVGNYLVNAPWGSGYMVITQAFAGGGSGSTQVVTLTAGEVYEYQVGEGARGGRSEYTPSSPISDGGLTFFHVWRMQGGGSSKWDTSSGTLAIVGVSYGNLATQPTSGEYTEKPVTGGKGGSTIGTYGDGGDSDIKALGYQPNGNSGAIILTYLG